MLDSLKRWFRQTAFGGAVVEGARYVEGKYKYKFRLSSSPGHYYSPIPSARDLERVYGRELRLGAVPEISLREDAQFELLEHFGSFAREFATEEKEADSRYNGRNEMFNGGDSLVLYSMIRHFRPTRIVEVGSGHSSALMLDVNDRWFNKEIALTFIEPFPDRLLSILRPEDHANTTILTTQVQDVDVAVFAKLGPGDFLFIDSSHVSKAGSDVNFLMFEVLPTLRAGVVVHFHDIYWPFEYPYEWAHEGRAWNENYMLRAFLAYNTRFEIVLFNNWLATTQADVARARMPGWSVFGTGSLWLRCVG
jgi:predicted O-methyltransferase YrrM